MPGIFTSSPVSALNHVRHNHILLTGVDEFYSAETTFRKTNFLFPFQLLFPIAIMQQARAIKK
jgi:hypothetical protein